MFPKLAIPDAKALYPLLAILSSLLIFVFGLSLVKTPPLLLGYVLGVLLLYALYGYGKLAARLLCFLLPLSCFVGCLALPMGRAGSALPSGLRFFLFGLGMVPSLGMRPVALQRSLRQHKLPRPLEIGSALAMNFLPLLRQEAQELWMIWRLQKKLGRLQGKRQLFRGFLLPFLMQIFHVSDLLSISLVTRGLRLEGDASCYKPPACGARDLSFLALLFLLRLGLVLLV